MKTYKIRRKNPFTESCFFTEVKGEPVKFKGFLKFEFFVHRPLSETGNIVGNMWAISEATTGFQIPLRLTAIYRMTKSDAINAAQKTLTRVGAKKLEKALKKARLMNKREMKNEKEVWY